MNTSRRRFFGLVVAVPFTAVAAPAIVEMVAADLAPVMAEAPASFGIEDLMLTVADCSERYIKPQMLRLADEIDAEVFGAMYGKKITVRRPKRILA